MKYIYIYIFIHIYSVCILYISKKAQADIFTTKLLGGRRESWRSYPGWRRAGPPCESLGSCGTVAGVALTWVRSPVDESGGTNSILVKLWKIESWSIPNLEASGPGLHNAHIFFIIIIILKKPPQFGRFFLGILKKIYQNQKSLIKISIITETVQKFFASNFYIFLAVLVLGG